MIFTKAEVSALWKWQHSFNTHPFTCPNRGDGKHTEIGSDLGMLVPTVRGWICPFCDYTQDWAHDFMKAEQPASPLESELRKYVSQEDIDKNRGILNDIEKG